MNLDDFKSLTNSVTAPASAPWGDTHLDGFVAKMRARDKQERRRWLAMALILFPTGLVLTFSGTYYPSPAALTGVGIMFVAAYMGIKGRWFGRVDYMVPARDFLATSADRYRFWRLQDAMFVIPLALILALGGGLVVWNTALKYLGDRGTLLAVTGYVVFLIALFAFAGCASWRNWKQKNAEILAEIHRRQRDLENG